MEKCKECNGKGQIYINENDIGVSEWNECEDCMGSGSSGDAGLDELFEDIPGIVEGPLKKEMVNSPKHYKLALPDGHPFEVIDILKATLTPEEFRGFLKGNIIKYQLRAGKKDISVQEFKKAQYYLDKLINELNESI